MDDMRVSCKFVQCSVVCTVLLSAGPSNSAVQPRVAEGERISNKWKLSAHTRTLKKRVYPVSYAGDVISISTDLRNLSQRERSK